MTPPPPTACLSNDSRLIAEALPLSLASISAFLMETFKWDEPPLVLAGFIFRETGGSECCLCSTALPASLASNSRSIRRCLLRPASSQAAC
jgi:hypothetical protein